MASDTLKIVFAAIVVALLYITGHPGRASIMDLPAGYTIIAGSPWGSTYPLAIYRKTSELTQGDIVIFCVAGNCYAGRIAGVERGEYVISGEGPTYPVKIPRGHEHMFKVIMLAPPQAWIPIALLLLAAVYMAAGGVLGSHWAYVAAVIVIAFLTLASLTPSLATTKLSPPRVVLVRYTVSEDYSIVSLNVDWDSLQDIEVQSCRVAWSKNSSLDTTGTIAGSNLIVTVPREAWASAAVVQKSRLVFLRVYCRVAFENGLVNVSVPVWTILPEPQLEVGGGIVSLRNPTPVPVDYSLDIVVFRGDGRSKLELIHREGTLSPEGILLVYFGDSSRVIVNGFVRAPWGQRPVGASVP